nr:MAG TPA: hypothetical protein [Caudoviricetes sp.]
MVVSFIVRNNKSTCITIIKSYIHLWLWINQNV